MSDASMRARQAAYAKHSQYDARESTQAARRAFHDRFIDQVDPDRTLPMEERLRRADAAKKSHMTMLARKSAQARSRR